jgi:hypothetical protein
MDDNMTQATAPAARPPSGLYVVVTALFVTALITSNITAVKIAELGPLALPAAVVIFPLSYILGDVLTEVYGYARARQTIWIGFGCDALAVVGIWLAGRLPAAPFWVDAGGFDMAMAYQRILGVAPRILAASFLAFLLGEFANAMVMSRLKVATQGRFLWVRTIGSTLVGEGLDSLVFITVAFGFDPRIVASQWLFKSAYEALATPITYWVVARLKKAENSDPYDVGVGLNPLAWRA